MPDKNKERFENRDLHEKSLESKKEKLNLDPNKEKKNIFRKLWNGIESFFSREKIRTQEEAAIQIAELEKNIKIGTSSKQELAALKKGVKTSEEQTYKNIENRSPEIQKEMVASASNVPDDIETGIKEGGVSGGLYKRAKGVMDTEKT